MSLRDTLEAPGSTIAILDDPIPQPPTDLGLAARNDRHTRLSWSAGITATTGGAAGLLAVG